MSQISMKSLLTALTIASALLLNGSIASAKPCGGCKELKTLKEELTSSLKKDSKTQFGVVEKIADQLSKTPRNAEGLLDKEQVHLLIEIISLAKDEGFRQELLERNEVLFRDNRPLFAQQLEKMSGDDPKQILRDIDSIIIAAEHGQEPPKDVLKKLGPPPASPLKSK
jgi:hypothetical protein